MEASDPTAGEESKKTEVAQKSDTSSDHEENASPLSTKPILPAVVENGPTAVDKQPEK